jgi:hypothetical protein
MENRGPRLSLEIVLGEFCTPHWLSRSRERASTTPHDRAQGACLGEHRSPGGVVGGKVDRRKRSPVQAVTALADHHRMMR